MCFSSTVSYSAAVVLISTGIYTAQQSRRRLPAPYTLWALIPIMFGIQQAFEGRVWQQLDAGNASAAVTYALGFHFFSHFLWLWWLPLSSYLIEPIQTSNINKLRKKIIGACAIMGAFAGTLVYSVILLHPEWMNVLIKGKSIVYDFQIPYQSDIHIPITPVMLYVMIILVPLLFSSHKLIRIFGVLVVLSMVLTSIFYNAAFVSVWCLFAALLSLYLAYMIRQFVSAAQSHPTS